VEQVEHEQLMTAAEVAARLKVSRAYAYELATVVAGPDRLPSIRFGKSVRFRAGDVERWLSEHER